MPSWLSNVLPSLGIVVLVVGVIATLFIVRWALRQTTPLRSLLADSLAGAFDVRLREAESRLEQYRTSARLFRRAHGAIVVGEFVVGLVLITGFGEHMISRTLSGALGAAVLVGMFVKYFYRLELSAALAELRASRIEPLIATTKDGAVALKEAKAGAEGWGKLLERFTRGLEDIQKLHL